MRNKNIPVTVEEQQEAAASMPQLAGLSRAIDANGNIRVGEQPIASMDTPTAHIAGRPRDERYDNLKRSVMMRHEATGIQPVTILNFLPIPLVLNSSMESLKVRIPAAPDPKENGPLFSYHIFAKPEIVPMEQGENIKMPFDYLPIQLAKAFLDEYREMGGIVIIKGVPNLETLSLPENVQAMETAKDGMVLWMRRKVEEANGQWNTPNHSGERNIQEPHRRCALYLLALGLIDRLPDWVTETRELKDVAKKCPVCAAPPKDGAAICVCNYVLNPMAAFIAGAITEEDLSLERLTRAEVEELGISDYVAETTDERPERLKARRAKPVSAVVAAGYAAQQQLAAEPAAL